MIQDDKRENELIRLFGLKQNVNRKRHDIDAFLDVSQNRINFELKSTTVGSISSASPLTLAHIKKWRKFHWIFGIYDKSTEKLQHCVYASPAMMKKWLDYLEEDINRGITISYDLAEKIDFGIMYKVLGKKDFYTKEEVKKIFKKLYTPARYKELRDHKKGYSPIRTLFMFKEHNLAYLIKGSWLNNPKIPQKYYKGFPVIRGNWKESLKNILKGSV
jgi:hypothetical protein